MREILKILNKLNQIYKQFDLLNFRAHKALPLTFNKKDSEKLLPQNKRFYFSYSYLNREKSRLTNLLLSKIVNLKDPQFKDNPTIHPQLIDKALKLKNIDGDSPNSNLEIPTRDRKINKLKQLISLIEEKNIGLCRGYTSQISVILFQNFPGLFPLRDQKYQPQELLTNSDFRNDLMQFDYDRYLYKDFKPEHFIKYLIYQNVQRVPSDIKTFDARKIFPDAKDCGFSGIAYEVELDGTRECFVTFKGTEADMDYTENSRSKRIEKFLLEGYKDWNYNVNSILIGNNKELRQLLIAQEFTKYVKDNTSKSLIYGIGHSLVGTLSKPYSY
jgi:hypothetical protein